MSSVATGHAEGGAAGHAASGAATGHAEGGAAGHAASGAATGRADGGGTRPRPGLVRCA